MNKRTAILLVIVLLVIVFSLSACNSPKNKFYKTTIGNEEYIALFYHKSYSSQNLFIYQFDSSTQRWENYDLGGCLAERYTKSSGEGVIIPDTVIYIPYRPEYTAYRLVEQTEFDRYIRNEQNVVIGYIAYDINNPEHAACFHILIETHFNS